MPPRRFSFYSSLSFGDEANRETPSEQKYSQSLHAGHHCLLQDGDLHQEAKISQFPSEAGFRSYFCPVFTV